MEQLRVEIEDVERRCDTINKRESLLCLRVTKFASINKIQTEIKPFSQLWAIAFKFNKTYPVWMEGHFEDLNAEEVEENVTDWWKSLNRLSKTPLQDHYHPMNLLSYLLRTLEDFKEYIPMVSALRTKGFTNRHWTRLSEIFSMPIDTSTLSLKVLIAKKLHEAAKLEKIKGVSDYAIKEYAIQTTLENLENEIKSSEFSPMVYKDTKTHILKGTDELISQFEEYSIKVAALRANHFAQNFNERISKVEREIKIIEDVLDEWSKAQRSWMYLEPIFQSEDISKQMPQESNNFQNLDLFYRMQMKAIVSDPNVLRISRRDGFLMQLSK